MEGKEIYPPPFPFVGKTLFFVLTSLQMRTKNPAQRLDFT